LQALLPGGPLQLFEQHSVLAVHAAPAGLQVGEGSRNGATWLKYAAKAPSTVEFDTESQTSPTLVPQAPESWPTTWPALFTTGAPLLPPSVAPSTSWL
jgi:hypothetical protein